MVASVCIQSCDSKDGAEGFIVERTLGRWGIVEMGTDFQRFVALHGGVFYGVCEVR